VSSAPLTKEDAATLKSTYPSAVLQRSSPPTTYYQSSSTSNLNLIELTQSRAGFWDHPNLDSEQHSICRMNSGNSSFMFKFRPRPEGGNVAPPREEGSQRTERTTNPSCNIHFTTTRPSLIPPRTSSPPKVSSCSLSSQPTIKTKKEIKPKPETHAISLRPKVPAADRIRSWETPYSIKFKDKLSESLPPELINTLQSTIFKALAPNTRSSYGAGILRFIEFCDKYNIPENSRMPASNILLAAFISEHSGTCSGSCITNWMSGLKAWHDFNGAPWHGDSRLVHLTRSTANKEGKKFSRPQRNPITLDHLRALRSRLTLSDPLHAATWAIACCAFWGCRRLGELTIPSHSAFDAKFHVTRNIILKNKFDSNVLKSVSFPIPWTKSAKERGGRIVLTARSDELCPIAALLNHLNVRTFTTLHLTYLHNSQRIDKL